MVWYPLPWCNRPVQVENPKMRQKTSRLRYSQMHRTTEPLRQDNNDVSVKKQLFLCNKICESCRRFANFGLKVSKYRRIWNVTSLALKDWQTKHLQGVAQVSSASKRWTKLAYKSFKSRDNTSKYYTRTWLEVKTGRCFRHRFLAKIT